MNDELASAGKRRADGSQITFKVTVFWKFQNISKEELRALYNPRSTLNDIKSLTKHMK